MFNKIHFVTIYYIYIPMMNIQAKELVAFWPQAVQSKLGSNSQSLASWRVWDSLDVLSVLTTLGHLHLQNTSAILP